MIKRLKRTPIILAGLAFSTLSCATAAVPPALSPEDSELLSTVHFPARVGVEQYQYPVYSERLVKSLRSTGLFVDVQPLEAIADPDLIATVRRPIYGTATMAPLLTIVTLGIVPTIVAEEWGESFTLRSANADSSSVDIEFTYSGPTTLGWVALIRALSPGHVLGRPHEKPRFQRALAAAIAKEASRINRMLEQ